MLITVLLGCNGATISDDVTFCQVHIPLKLRAYNHETVLLGGNGATISDVPLKVLIGRHILSSTYPTENSCL